VAPVILDSIVGSRAQPPSRCSSVPAPDKFIVAVSNTLGRQKLAQLRRNRFRFTAITDRCQGARTSGKLEAKLSTEGAGLMAEQFKQS
jgi:hypothetical protein